MVQVMSSQVFHPLLVSIVYVKMSAVVKIFAFLVIENNVLIFVRIDIVY